MRIPRRKFLLNSAQAAAAAALAARFPSATAQSSGQVPAAPLAADLARDPRRPQFHLLPARNWMNDPNGPIFFKGSYHMFFQYNPNAAVWGDMHWAHAVSPDMLHWRHLPVALAPTPGGPDADGCFSGTAVINNGVPTFIYTGVAKSPVEQATLRDGHNNFRETQLYATSSDPNLATWTKLPAPVIATPPKGMQVTGFRDPAPWKNANATGPDAWLMAVGSGQEHKGGDILLYQSPDLKSWEYLHLLATGEGKTGTAANPVDSGDMWECPDFFPLGNKHLLIYSTQGKVFWQSGEIDPKELVFQAAQSGLLDYGSFYAPKTQLDASGNRILWGWIQETRPEAEYSASGWAGLMSLPRVLTLGADDRLRITPAPIVDKLRKHEQRLHLTQDESANKQKLAALRIQDACAELLCTLKRSSAAKPEPFTLNLLDATPPNGAPKDPTSAVASQVSFLSIRYSEANPHELVVDQQRLPLNLAPDEPLELHLYIDGSVIELFANHQSSITRRFYYPGSTAPQIALSITGKTAAIQRLSLWQLNPISKDRLTT